MHMGSKQIFSKYDCLKRDLLVAWPSLCGVETHKKWCFQLLYTADREQHRLKPICLSSFATSQQDPWFLCLMEANRHLDRNRDNDMMKGFYHLAQHEGNNVNVNLKFNDISLMSFVEDAAMVGTKEYLFVIFE